MAGIEISRLGRFGGRFPHAFAAALLAALIAGNPALAQGTIENEVDGVPLAGIGLRGTRDAADLSGEFDAEMPDGEMPVGEFPVGEFPVGEVPAEPADAPVNLPANQREASVGAVADPINSGLPDARANIPAVPVENGIARPIDEDPFMPAGFRAGTWQVFTRVEQAIGYATNAGFEAGGGPGAFSQTDGEIRMQSDWSRHSAEITASGSVRQTFGEEKQTVPEAALAGKVTLDLIDDHALTFEGGYDYSTEDTSSNALDEGVSDRPGVHVLHSAVELTKARGRLETALRGSFDRTTYEDATFQDGQAVSQADRNNNVYEIAARVAYGPSEAIKPFIFAGVGRRQHDAEFDRNGLSRDSNIYDMRAGVELDFGEKFGGEIAAGYLKEAIEDDRLNDLSSPSLNGELFWSPERDTILTLTAATSLSGATNAGDSGSAVYDLRVEATRRIRDDLAVNAFGNAVFDRAPGETDATYTAGVGLEYFISRYLSLTADLEYQRFESATPGDSWESTTARVGVALQR